MSHLLVTNDFPPKQGGIQVYLWELWRRLEPGSFTVFTASSHPAASSFDESLRALGHEIERTRSPVLLPTPEVARSIRRFAKKKGADLVVLDPVFPLGFLGPSLGVPYALVVHGAETTVPGRIPGLSDLMRAVMNRATVVICAGEYPAADVRRICGGSAPHVVVVPPGVDTERFRPLEADERKKARQELGVEEDALLVTSVSRLVPRKGMDTLIAAASGLAPSFPGLRVLVGGDGRDRSRLQRLVSATNAPVQFLGRVDDEAIPRLYAAGDVFAMVCRDRWMGLEQEGFGIVFLEAASCGVPQVAGRSGGSVDAVTDGETGLVVEDPSDPGDVAVALRSLLSDPEVRGRMGEAARRRMVDFYDYDDLSRRLAGALSEVGG